MDQGTANGKSRFFRTIDLALDFCSAANVGSIARIGAMGLVCVIFYSFTQDLMAESKRDREMFRQEVAKAHDLAAKRAEEQKELATAVKSALREMMERDKKRMEGRP